MRNLPVTFESHAISNALFSAAWQQTAKIFFLCSGLYSCSVFHFNCRIMVSLAAAWFIQMEVVVGRNESRRLLRFCLFRAASALIGGENGPKMRLKDSFLDFQLADERSI
jgi:hypothetical protein